MRNNFLINSVLTLLTASFVGGGAYMLPGLYQQRIDTEIDRVDHFGGEIQELATEIRIPTAALFAFRSLAIDYLWIRAEKLKQEGQYFDALYLARAICALQPNLGSVWDFQAWNMAYNISVGLPTGSERWEWVRAGFELVRDHGLKYNPRNLKLYWVIGWIFQHKIGAIADDYHRYYKLMFAYEMSPLLTPIYGDLTSRPNLADIKAMSELTTDYNELAADPGVKELMDSLLKTDPRFKSVEDVLSAMTALRISPPDQYAKEFGELIKSSADNPALWQLDRFSRARTLMKEWKLDPKVMHNLNMQYGPIDYVNAGEKKALDWRTPWAYSIYWAVQGLKYREFDIETTAEMNVTRLERLVYHSLQEMFHYGNVKIYQFQPESAFAQDTGREVFDTQQLELQIFNSQDLEMLQFAYQATVDLKKSYEGTDEEPPHGMDVAAENLMINGIQSLYLTGYRDFAQKYYDQLRNDFPEKEEYKPSLDEFVRICMRDQIKEITPKFASIYVMNILRDGYYQLALAEDENANVRQQWAQQIY
ncbi:MAG: hypothetical protein JXM68_09655, partial [Sedimentisphaerales bacterium]|nr:hypothetical protein [Sedimentisphaerales bacterium]